jgi:endonuclease YncB( thermonuclease family)
MTPIPKKDKIIMIIVIISAFVLVFLAIYLIYSAEEVEVDEEIYVRQIIDGDTFKMNTGETIRLLCVNTPEQDEPGYERATDFLENLILYKKIRLEQAETLDQIDKYERTLAFVYVDNLGKEIFINKLIIDAGFSDIYEYEDEGGECRGKVG